MLLLRNAGYACAAIPKNCGTTPNSPCCPSSYRTGFNPPLDKPVCPDNFYCEYDKQKGAFPGSQLLTGGIGICLRNAPDCEKLGKPCCIINTGSTSVITCNPGPGLKGYCAAADGSTKGVPYSKLMCQKCPDGGCPQESG
jgi:hypothetical protein